MDRPTFVIEATEAQSMANKSGLTLLQLLPTLVESAQSLARPPISNYHVGAVGLGSSGRIYFGANLEFPGLPLNQSVHAEQFLITNLALNAESALTSFSVSSAPCGHCRQFFQELRHAPSIQILITDQVKIDSAQTDKSFEPLSNLLPHRFGPDAILHKHAPLLLEPHHNDLSFTASNGFVPNANGSVCTDDDLKYAALEAANKSHAPYSKCPSGVAVMDCEGKVYKGSYTESVAYNPSLGPVQAAVVAYLVGGSGGGYDRIVKAVLVEKEGATVRQENTARLLLEVISPKCEFKVFHCRAA